MHEREAMEAQKSKRHAKLHASFHYLLDITPIG